MKQPPGSTTPMVIVDALDGSVNVQSPHRENLSLAEAMRLLVGSPDGTLGHPRFDRGSFVAMDRAGRTLFYHVVDDQFMGWNWVDDILLCSDGPDDPTMHGDWFYLPAAEMAMTVGGMGWWEEIRAGAHTPPRA